MFYISKAVQHMVTFREVISSFFFKPSEHKNCTHTLMDRGSLFVPPEKYQEFVKIYSDFVLSGGKAYVVELKTPGIFKMFFDFDVHLLEHPPSDFSIKIAKYIKSTISELFLDINPEIIVCETENKKTRKNGIECIKCGIHFHIPELHVSADVAKTIRTAVVQKLSNNMGTRPCPQGPTTWEEDVDSAVFEGSGLRLPFSRKMVACSTCKKTKDGCSSCLGTRQVDEGRAYVPTHKLKEDYSIEDISSQIATETVKNTSIRSEMNTLSHLLNPIPPCWLEFPSLITEERSKRKRLARDEWGSINEGHYEIESNLKGKEKLSKELLTSIQEWINKLAKGGTINKEYKKAEIYDGFTFLMNDVRSQCIIKIGSQFCQNIDREHNSNTVYMHINADTKQAFMKCFCRCNTIEGRITRCRRGKIVKCSDYRSLPIDATTITATIFPGYVPKNSDLNVSVLKMLC